MLSNERQQQVVALCQKLIQQQSYSGHEDGVVKALSEYLTAEGFDSVTVDKYGNIIGCIKGNRLARRSFSMATSIPSPFLMKPSGSIPLSLLRSTTARSTVVVPAI